MPVAYTFPVLPSSCLLCGISNRSTSFVVDRPELQISGLLVVRSESGEFFGSGLSLRRFQREGRRRLNAAGGGIHVVDNAPSRTSSLAASTSTIELPVTCYQLIGVSEQAEKDEVVKSVINLKKTDAEEGYTMEAAAARQDLLMDVRDKLLFESEYAGNLKEKIAPKSPLRIPWAWLPGALCLLQEVGQEKLVLDIGRAALRNLDSKPYIHDIFLSMALAECAIAKAAFEVNKVSQGFEALARAQSFLKSKVTLGKLALLTQIEESLEELAPPCTLDLLGLPRTPENAERRRGAIAALRELLRQGLSVEASCQIQDWPCFLSQAISRLLATEIVDLLPWDDLAITRKNKKSLESHNQRVVIDFNCFYMVLLGHIAVGFSGKQNETINKAKTICECLIASEGVDLKFEEAFCSFLLKQGSEAEALEKLKQLESNSDSAVRNSILGKESRSTSATPSLEAWLMESVLANFPDTRGCSPSLANFFRAEKKYPENKKMGSPSIMNHKTNQRPLSTTQFVNSSQHLYTAVEQLTPTDLQSPVVSAKNNDETSASMPSVQLKRNLGVHKNDNVPLSRFGVLVAQLESIVASASQKNPDPLLCFEILSDLISAIDEEPKESLLVTQRKCEDALYSLVTLGARRPVRHLASVAMAKIISNGDSISIYSRASSLQGFLSDGKRSDPQRVAGAAQCLGELYRHFGKKITSGLFETTSIVTKLVKFNEDFVRQEAFILLHNALEGCGGTAAATAYSEAYRLITRFSTLDKSFVVRIAAARCLKAFSNIGGPGLGTSEFDTLASYCVKGIEDSESSVRDAFAEALGSLLALGMHPEAHVQPRGKGPFPPAKKLEGGLQRHLILPFTKAVGSRAKNTRFGLALSWVFFLQAIRIRYLDSDSELQDYSLPIMDMLRGDSSIDAHALACVLYILRVGVIDQMMEPSQRSFSVFLGKQLQSSNASPSMKIVALRALSYTLKTLGEVPHEFKEFFDDTVGAALSHFLDLVRVEAALTLRALAEVDPTCVGGLTSFAVTTLNALRESLSFEKGDKLKTDLASLHGQAATLAALVSISPGLSLGYPARLPRSVLEVSKKMLTESRRNVTVASSEKEAGWLLLSSLLNSMPKEEFGDQDFDILILWTDVFAGNPEHLIKQQAELKSMLSVWSAAIDALTAFVRRFVSCNDGILLQPVLANLRSALSCVSTMANKRFSDVKTLVDILIIRILIAYQSIPDPLAYKSEHQQIIQLCTTPYRDPSGFEESSCLKSLLDKRDAWLGPWIPGRDWFEDELRYFQGGEDGLAPSVWESKVSSFPLPETVKKTLVNQMVLCFGIMFASQDSQGMLSLLSVIQQCLKAGKKQQWRTASLTNICAGLLAGLKALHALRPQQLTTEVLSSGQAIFQNILTEGDICASQRRAACEGLGLLARLGNDIFTARMTRVLLGDLSGVTDPNYGGSIALALGCIHHSAGGMALSSLVPATVNSVSSLTKTSVLGLKIWALHGLLLTIEAAGLSFVSHVQAALGLALDILLTEESGWIDLSQGIGRLINAIVAVLGPELSPGSILFSRCKSVIAEISSWQEIPTLLESVCFTQQLILFAPQAVSVHIHVKNLLMTLASRQPIIRRLSVSTLRHLVEKDPVSVIDEQIEDNLFQMLDEETDSEIGNLIRSTLIRLLYATCPSRPSRWMLICRNMALAASAGRSAETSIAENDPAYTRENLGDDDEDMVSSSSGKSIRANPDKDKTLRYRTRVFAAECLSLLPEAVGNDAAHFDILLARNLASNRQSSGDWLVLQLQELISLAYQISTIQFENMRPIGVGLLSTILEKFKLVADPELPGHLLLEQYQAQLLSAVRTALDANSGPVLLEAGLQLATKIMTSGIIRSDQVAVKRIFSLLSRPLNDFNELYYPSFAEWVTSKIKIRLLAAHASLKCYIFTFLRKHHGEVPVEFEALLPMFSKSSDLLGRYWIQVLKGYSYICLCQNLKKSCSFLDEILPHTVSRRLQPCLEEAWPVILQALVLDAIPVNHSVEEFSDRSLISTHRMVTLEAEDFQFLWGFAVLVLFQGMHPASSMQVIPFSSAKIKSSGDSSINESSFQGLKLYEIALPVFQSLSAGRFFSSGFLSIDLCQELLQVLSYSFHMDSSWDILAVSVVQQISQNCPKDFLESEEFAYSTIELCLGYLFKILHRHNEISPDDGIWDNMLSPLFISIKTLVKRFELKHRLNSAPLAFLLSGYKCIRQVPTDAYLPKALEIVKSTNDLLLELTRASSQKPYTDGTNFAADSGFHLRAIFGACLHMVGDLTRDCINGIQLVDSKRSGLRKLLQLKLVFCLEQLFSLAKLAYEFDCPVDETNTNSICIVMLKSCQISIAAVVKDSNVQVQATVLQVLKSLVQRYNNPEEKSFVILFVGELIGDIVSLMQRALLKPVNTESVVIAGECLRFIMLLQTHSITDELQKGFMSLFLEVVLVVFSKTSDGVSQEVLELRNVAVRLVSHLAQLPSSAVHFKDVLLSLPVTHRQQLQDIIRASVSKDSALAKPKSLVPAMDIKLPAPVVATPEKVTSTANMVKEEALSTMPTSFNQVSTVESGTDEEEEEEEDDDDDDWDTFQSFPASTNLEGSESKTESVAEEEPDLPGRSSIQDDESNAEETDDQHLASDHATDITREDSNDKSKEVVEEETVEPCFTTREDSVDKSKEVEEETVKPCLIEDALTSQNDKTSSGDHPVEINEQSVESKNLESENIGTDIKLASTEVESPALDDLEPQQIQKSPEDESSKEHVGADVIVTEETIAENKSDVDYI